MTWELRSQSKIQQCKPSKQLLHFYINLYLKLLFVNDCQSKYIPSGIIMTSLNVSNVIEIDDDDSRPAINNTILTTKGITSSSYPLLYQLLQRRAGEKVKAQQEKKKDEVCEPMAIPVPVAQVMNPPCIDTEVCKVVPILQTIRQLPPRQNTQNENDSKESLNDKKQIIENIKVDENDILIVEEILKPLVPLQQFLKSMQNPKPQENVQQMQKEQQIQPQLRKTIEEKMIEEAAAEVVNFIQQAQNAVIQQAPFCEQIPQAENFQRIPEVLHSQIAPLLEAKQAFNQQQRPIQSQQPNSSHPNPSINQEFLPSNQPIIQQAANGQITVQIEQNLQLIPQSADITKRLTIQQIRRVIIYLIPELRGEIESMCEQVVRQVFKGVQVQMSTISIQEVLKSALTPEELYRLVEREPAAEQCQYIKQNSMVVIDPLWSQLETLRFFKTLSFQDLIKVINTFYKYQNDPFGEMTHQNLIEIVDQSIKLFQSNHQPLQQKQPQSIPQPVPQSMEVENQAIYQNTPQSIINNQTTVAEMKQFLLLSIPSLKQQQLQYINDDYIEMLYDGAKKGQFSRAEIAQKIQAYSASNILNACIKKFPHLQQQLTKISKQELQTVFENLTNSNNINSTSNKSNQIKNRQEMRPINPQADRIVHISQKQVIDLQNQPSFQPQLPCKRTNDMMPSSLRKIDERSDSKRKEVKQLREKLMKRLPELKQNILKLDDNEIEKVYRDSIVASNQNNKKIPKPQGERPVIIMKERKTTDIMPKPDKSKDSANLKKGSETIAESQFENGKIYQISNPAKKRKTRTIVFVHTEELSDEEQSNGFKVRNTQNGIQKKPACDCAQKETVGDLLKRLTDFIDKKQ